MAIYDYDIHWNSNQMRQNQPVISKLTPRPRQSSWAPSVVGTRYQSAAPGSRRDLNQVEMVWTCLKYAHRTLESRGKKDAKRLCVCCNAYSLVMFSILWYNIISLNQQFAFHHFVIYFRIVHSVAIKYYGFIWIVLTHCFEWDPCMYICAHVLAMGQVLHTGHSQPIEWTHCWIFDVCCQGRSIPSSEDAAQNRFQPALLCAMFLAGTDVFPGGNHLKALEQAAEGVLQFMFFRRRFGTLSSAPTCSNCVEFTPQAKGQI